MIIICGDFHGNFSQVNEFLNKKPEISMILQCGDFGYWPRIHNQSFPNGYGKNIIWNQYALKNKDIKILWCDGNHEDHEALGKLKDIEIMPNVFYAPRGFIYELPDGRTVLFMGGAYSIDRESRVHRSELFGWFEEETISQKDIINLPDEHIDIVISHTCPNEFVISDYHISYGHDPSRDALSYILDKYRPRFWYFGHMHTFKQGINKGCKWTCLSGIGINSHRWWIELEK